MNRYLNNLFLKILTFLIIAFIPIYSFSHSGRTDSSGGHWNRKTGTYHYHNSGYSTSNNNRIDYSSVLNNMPKQYTPNYSSYTYSLKFAEFDIYHNDKIVTNNYSNPVKFSKYPLSITLKPTSFIANTYDWYIWNDGVGWVWFSNIKNPICQVWKEGASIKLVINNNPNDYAINNFASQFEVNFKIIRNDEDITYANNLLIGSYPYTVSLENLTESYTQSWYIWNDGLGWVWFSNEKYPYCNIWTSSAAIKMVINNDPTKYKIHVIS